jgi:ubiquinone/menaquinone biosynthesis C-methylase UbiE
MPDSDWWEVLWPDPAKVLTDVGMIPGTTVVDLCAGDGWFTLPIARLAKHVFAVDIDGRLLDVARTRLSGRHVRNCDFIEGDAYDVGRLIPDPVDFVFLANTFHGVPDKLRLAKAVRDILKPGGLFAIINWHARPREDTKVLGTARGPATALRMTPDATIASLAASGLAFRKIVELPPYHYGAIFEKPIAS